MNIYKITIFLVVYLICSINPAIIICKKKTGEDIRKLGSGNAGTANARRVLGKPLGTLVILLDIAKVFVSFYAVSLVGKVFKPDTEETIKSIFIVASVMGHCFPIYYGFRGGKGVIVGITSAFMIDKKIALVALIVGLIVILITRLVSLGTLSGLGIYVIMTLVMQPVYTFPVIIAAIIVMHRHRANIQRMVARQEDKLW